MKTPMHMSMGEEAIVVGVCSALADEDQVLGTYRSHALFLAKKWNDQHAINFHLDVYPDIRNSNGLGGVRLIIGWK